MESKNSSPLPLMGVTYGDCTAFLVDSYRTYADMYRRADNLVLFFDIAKRNGIQRKLRQHGLRRIRAERWLLEIEDRKQLERLATADTRLSMTAAREAVAVAVLTLWHSALDEFLSRLLRLGCVLNRPAALQKVGQRQIATSALREKAVADLENEVIEKWLVELDKAPLLKKLDLVFALSPLEVTSKTLSTRFDTDWLRDFDRARHNGVHGDCRIAAQFNLKEARSKLFHYGFALLYHHTSSYSLAIAVYALNGHPGPQDAVDPKWQLFTNQLVHKRVNPRPVR